MTAGLSWGYPVILYLFLAGMGAGAVTVSSSMLLRGGRGAAGAHHEIARDGALLGPIPLILGVALIVLELGSFHAGHYFRFINLFLVINLSPMSLGSWLLLLFIVSSCMYAYTYLQFLPMVFGDRIAWRRALAWVNIPLGLGVAVYTGVLLGAMPSRPFWNSPILALLFLISALSSGVALIVLSRALSRRAEASADQRRLGEQSGYLLAAADTLLVGIEILSIFLFLMFAYLTVGDVRVAVATILPGGSLAALFWIGVVFIGLILPGLCELYMVAPKLLYQREYVPSRSIEIAVAAAVIFGGFLLRYVVVVAGQVTGPVGM